jgi:hypothetical protein
MIELTTNRQRSLAPAASQSLHFEDEVEEYLVSKDDNFERKLERNMFISQLTLYNANPKAIAT